MYFFLFRRWIEHKTNKLMSVECKFLDFLCILFDIFSANLFPYNKARGQTTRTTATAGIAVTVAQSTIATITATTTKLSAKHSSKIGNDLRFE